MIINVFLNALLENGHYSENAFHAHQDVLNAVMEPDAILVKIPSNLLLMENVLITAQKELF